MNETSAIPTSASPQKRGGRNAKSAPTVDPLPRLTTGVEGAAAMFDVSANTFRGWMDQGMAPAPLHPGGRILFRVSDLQQWASLGMPNREVFEQIKKVGGGNAAARQ